MPPTRRSRPKHPLRRFPSPTLPPAARSRVALGLTAFAAQGRLALQVCRDCATVHYPPQEACRQCLSLRLVWRPQDSAGELISDTVLRHSNELYFRARVRLRAALDRAGAAVLAALPDDEVTTMADDRVLRELTNDPAGRKILITDGRAPVAASLARALAAAGAELIYVGMAQPWPPAAVAPFAQI